MASRAVPTHPYLDWPGPIPFAHRGGAGDAPENTMAAFRHAVSLGYRYLETDVQLSADGVLFAFHDDDLERTCGVPGRISSLPASVVTEARVGGRAAIPTLAELLESWPDVRVNIDCKSDAAVEPLAAAVRAHRALHRVCLASFSDRRLVALRRSLGLALCSAAGTWELAALKLLGRTAGFAVAQVPVRHRRVTVVDRRFVERCHRRQVPVHVWTVDEAVEMERLLDLGADGLMTDRPAVLRDVLRRRGQWVE